MKYFVKTPWWLARIYSGYVWKMPAGEKKIYLTFDDGPHPTITTYVLDVLKKYNARASFFCIGKNVAAHPEIYARILAEGHSVGNHTQNHLNGWQTDTDTYVENVKEAQRYIASKLFRPPYGKIKNIQAKHIKAVLGDDVQIIMWSVLSGDFDISLSKEKCLKNIITKSGDGSIIVLHDSEKAWPRLSYSLGGVLEYFQQRGYSFEKL